jgi:carboxyl-terminal processing protease
LFALVLHFVFISLVTAAQSSTKINPEDNLAVFDEVWKTVGERYYDPNMRGVDWEAQRRNFRETAANAADKQKLYNVLREMLGSLRDSHTRVFAPEEASDWRTPRVVGIGVSVREVENRLVVIRVEKKSQAEKSGVRVGSVLTKIDGVAANTVFEQKISETRGASTAAIGRVQSAARLFEGSVGTTVAICWQKEKSKERCVQLKRELRTINSDVRVEREKNILIIGFDIFTLETASRILGILRQNLDKVKGIVIDLRGNRGGTSDASVDLASVFLPEKTEIGNFIDRNGRVAHEAQTRQSPLFIVNSVKVTDIPVVILTGTVTASSAEIFTAALKNAKRARTIGTTTCGCVLAVRREHTLPDGGKLEVSELDFKLSNGERLEGVGIAPDEPIEMTIADIRDKRDRALEKAIASLSN